MVDGCKNEIGSCVAVDLDNTLITGNSTKMLAGFLIKKLVRQASLHQLFAVSRAILKRKLKKIPHSEMKHLIVGISQSVMSQSDIDKFAAILERNINPRLKALLTIYANKGHKILIATAAADFFLSAFTKRLPFHADFIATPYSDDLKSYTENRGEHKRRAVEEYLSSNSLSLAAFFTDHKDDMPLLKYNPGENYLVNPSETTIKAVKSEGISYEII